MVAIDWIIVVGYLALTIAIGLSFAKKAGKDLSSFFLGGRNLPWYIAGLSMVATTFAADTPLAVASIIGNEGISGNWVWWSFLFGGMLTVFFFARQWRRSGVLTEVELIELRYSGKPGRFLRGFKAVYLGLFMNMLILAWVNVALVTILQGFFDLSREQALLITGATMLFTAIYSSLSGLLGVAITDAFQFVIAMVGCIVLAIIVLHSEQIGGVEALKEKLAASGKSSVLEFFPKVGGVQTGGLLVITLTTFLAYVGIQWWASWYPGAEPGGGGYIAQRMMSAKNERHSIFATLFFQVAHYAIRPWPWIIVGLCAVVLYKVSDGDLEQRITVLKGGTTDTANAQKVFQLFPDINARMAADEDFRHLMEGGISSKQDLLMVMPELEARLDQNKELNDEVIYAFDRKSGYVYAMKDFLPVGLKGLLLVAFFAAYMSTISTQLNWGASYVVNDLYKRFIRVGRSERHYVLVSRLATIVMMGLGLIASTFVEDIEDVWKFLMACGAGLGLVLILRWYWWRINAWTEIAATITPVIGMILVRFLEHNHPDPFSDFGVQLMVIVSLTTIVWLTVMFFTRPTEETHLQSFYKRVKPWGWWGPVARGLSEVPSRGPLGGLLVCWLSSVVVVYAILFATGKWILHEWNEAFMYSAIGAIGLIVLLFAVKRTRVFRE